ncbi:GGDEF domain-containing protein [uncultured Exiguobacterium sp.]|uniref:GGDEF domain-containing protein n=1 Tax=uncultured Exiguobacterium sp. TaxID=202669 RepID=UPI0025DAC7EF|nr:GGDEF domain-containing protein [uncultured Exiguobacterium sp.]
MYQNWLGVVVFWLLLHLGWVAYVGTDTVIGQVVNSLFTIGGVSVSLYLIWQARRRQMRRPFTSRLFLLLLFANTMLGLGECGQLVYFLQERTRTEPFDWIDLIFSLQIVIYIVAFGYFLQNRRREVNLRVFLFDEFIILVVAGSLSWHYLVTPYFEANAMLTFETILWLRYPLGDLLLLGGMIVLFFGLMKRGNGSSLLLILIAFHFQLLADLLYVVLERFDYPFPSSWLDPLWLATVMIVGLAAYRFDAEESFVNIDITRRWIDVLRLITPYLFLLILFVTMARQTISWNGLTIGLMIAIPLLISRQIRIVVDNQRLRENLEAKVEERTEALASAMEEMRQMAYHDALTGLPNRYLFARLFQDALYRAEANDRQVGLFFIDIDHFKQVNDTYGHHVGDQLIIDVTIRLQKKLPPHTVISRQGGDEFVVLLFDVEQESEVVQCGEHLVSLFRKPFHHGIIPLPVTASIGGTIYPAHAASRADLIEFADLAMYEAKRRGKNQFYLYESMVTNI